MKKIIITLFAILSATPATASDWQLASNGGGAYVYIDESSIVALSPYRVIAWRKFMEIPKSDLVRSAKMARVIYDCKYKSTVITYIASYDSNSKSDYSSVIPPSEQTEDPVMPDTLNEGAYEFVCHQSAVSMIARQRMGLK